MNKKHEIRSVLLCSKNEKEYSSSCDIHVLKVNDAVNCMSEATIGVFDLIAVVFERDDRVIRREFLELCRALKSNRLTCNTPLLAVLDSLDRRLLEKLDQAKADYIHLAGPNRLRSLDQLLRAVNGLDLSKMPRSILEKVCPLVHYSDLESGQKLVSCGAHDDILVLGNQRINSFCSTLKHRTCTFFLAPKTGRFNKGR